MLGNRRLWQTEAVIPPSTEKLSAIAVASGASVAGVASIEPFDEALRGLRHSLSQGRSGPLRFTYDEPVTATDLRTSFPWARSMMVVGVDYLPRAHMPHSNGAIVGRFATSDHYEPVRLVTDAIATALIGFGARAEILIDDNRLVDRAAAVRAGIGWRGRSTMVLAPFHGPWMLLGSVVTDAELAPSAPMRRDCGTCVACIPACPTGAIDDQGLDARRCLSTWLQTPGSLPHWIRPLLGRRIYGCDDCLASCPPGFRALQAQQGPASPLPFAELLALDDHAMLERFPWWYVPRRDARYMRRNILVAAGNSSDSAVVTAIAAHLHHRSSMIRGHAAWSLARLLGRDGRQALLEALEEETAPEAREEILLALLMVCQPGAHAEMVRLDEATRSQPGMPGLAVLGVDLSTNAAPGPDVDYLIADGHSPAVDPERLAGLIRVHDPHRRLEMIRRQARASLSSRP